MSHLKVTLFLKYMLNPQSSLLFPVFGEPWRWRKDAFPNNFE